MPSVRPSRMQGAGASDDAPNGPVNKVTNVLSNGTRKPAVFLLIAVLLLPGCAAPRTPLQYLVGEEHKTLSYYRNHASAIEYPTEPEGHETAAELFTPPRTLRSLEDATPREMTLQECFRRALNSSAVIRDDSSFGSPANPLLSRPNQAPSVYDNAIQSTGFLFGNRGSEAALSDFDARLTASSQWGRSEDVQNVGTFGIPNLGTLTQETWQSSARLEKPLATGGAFSLQNDWNYTGSNQNAVAFPSAFSGFLQAEYRQPLWGSSGVEYTRIAGPASQNLQGVSGVSQGVLISRINEDISLIDFEQNTTSLLRDIESRYWDHWLALKLYKSEIEAFRDLLQHYRRLSLRGEAGDASEQALARLYEAEARIRGSLADILENESRLRRLMGMPPADGTFIYPVDLPTESLLEPNWQDSLAAAFSQRPELRRQKWEIKSLELQLKAARNQANPRFDMVSQYRINAFGDRFLPESDRSFGSALQTLTSGNHETWNLGLQFSLPVGRRLAHTQIRNYELRLTKARVALGEQEREIAYEISSAMINMQRWYELADSTTKRMSAADRYVVSATQKSESAGGGGADMLNLLLQAEIAQRDAQQAYMRSIVEYNKAISDLNFRTGTLLAANNVYLAEAEWNPEANNAALQRSMDRTHALENNHLRVSPGDFIRGPAPSAWESIGVEARPHEPGAIEQADSLLSARNGRQQSVLQPPDDVPPAPDDVSDEAVEQPQDVPPEAPPADPESGITRLQNMIPFRNRSAGTSRSGAAVSSPRNGSGGVFGRARL